MKVLFVWPNKDVIGFKPIGLSLLIGLCKQRGHTVDLFDTSNIDFGFIPNKDTMEEMVVFEPVDFSDYNIAKKKTSLEGYFLDKLTSFNPEVIAYSALSDEKFITIECTRIAKGYNHRIINIIGGKYATTSPEEALSHKTVDFICIGEGLEVFSEFLDALQSGKDPQAVDSIWHSKDNKVIRNRIRPLKQNLDDLPYLDWSLFTDINFYRPYKGSIFRHGDWALSQGCIYECSYCINKYLHDLYGKKNFLRRYSPERAIKELECLKESYRLEFLKFHDEDFLLGPIDHIRKFALMYKEKIGLPFVIETNAKSVNEEKAEILKEMNCQSVSIGVESGNELLRRNILNRKESLEEIKRAFAILNDKKIRTVCFLMLNIPFDSRKAIFDSIELVREASVRIPNVGIFFPFEKTKAREISIENNFYNPEEMPVYQTDLPALNQPSITRDEVMRLRKVFVFYAKLPKSFWPLIEQAEKFDETGKEIYATLKNIYIKHVREQDDYFREIE